MFDFSKRMSRAAMASLVTVLALAGCGGDTNGSGATTPPTAAAPPASTKAMVGAEGGTVNGPDGVQVVIAAGALSQPTEVGISNDGSGAMEIGGIKPISKVIAVTPHGTEFGESARISLPFSPADVGAAGQPVIIKSQPGGSWTALKSDVVGSMVSADISGFSYYAVGTCYTSRDVLVPGPDPLIACPSAHSLKLELLDSAGVALPVLRNSNGVAIPVLTITEPAQLKIAFTYSRPPSGRLDRIFTLASGAVTPPDWPRDKPFGGPNDTQLLAGYQTTLAFDANPSTVPNASRPGGIVVRFRASVTTQMDAFYLGCLCFKLASWTYEAEVPVRVIFAAPVTPPPSPVATYTVSGTVSGLTGAGLVLRNNGAGNLTVAASATAFTFAAPVNAGSAYAVTVLSQPTGQTCSVQNGSGTTSANVGNVAVSCAVVVAGAKAWQGASLLETLDVGEALEPRIAFDTQGNAMASWYQVSSIGGNYKPYARRYSPGTGWGAVAQIPTDPLWNNAYSTPQIAFAPSGNAVAVFSGCIPDGCAIWSAQFTAATATWGTATELIAGAGNSPQAQIASDAAGNALVVWQERSGISSRILAVRFEAGTSTWGAARVLSADLGGFGPKIAFDASGNAIAIWAMRDTANATGYKLMSDRYVAGSGWHPQGLPTTIATLGDGGLYSLAVGAAGSAMAVWNQYVGTTLSLYSSRYAAGAWAAPSLDGTKTNMAGSYSVSVAMDGNGNAIVVWDEIDSGDVVSSWARRFVAGVGGAAVRIDDLTAGRFPRIAMDAAGNAMAVWEKGSSTWANRYVAGTGWAGPMLIDDTNGGRSSSPDVAVDGNGNAIAVWTKSSGLTSVNIWANVFR